MLDELPAAVVKHAGEHPHLCLLARTTRAEQELRKNEGEAIAITSSFRFT